MYRLAVYEEGLKRCFAKKKSSSDLKRYFTLPSQRSLKDRTNTVVSLLPCIALEKGEEWLIKKVKTTHS